MEFSAKNLKQKLWGTLLDLEGRKIDPKTANSMISAAREIVAVVRTELDMIKLNKPDNNGLKLLGD